MKFGTKTLLLILIIVIIACSPAIAVSNVSAIDLAFDSLSSAPASAPGSPLYAMFAIENNGEQISMTEKVTLFLSNDTTISTADYQVGQTEVEFLRPGASVEKGIVCTVPERMSPGTYYIGAILTGKSAITRDAHDEDNVITGNSVTISSTFARPQTWDNGRISDLVWKYTNEERKKRSLGELKRDEHLDLIAQNMSDDMAKRQFFDHTNPDGEDPVDRAERQGYNQLRYLPGGEKFSGISENIVKIPVGEVYKFGEINPNDPDQIAQVAIKSFMNSPTHKATLLLPEFEVIGLGTAYDGKNYYVTQNFF